MPLEDPRSWIIQFSESETIRRCLVEIPASLMAISFPRTNRPIRIVDPGLYSKDSPSLGPLTTASFSSGGVIVSESESVSEKDSEGI